MDTEQEIQHAADQCYTSRFAEIGRLVKLFDQAAELGHDEWTEAIRERIEEMALCVDLVAIYPNRDTCEWEILLGTGGPADRVLVVTDFGGDFDQAKYQHQDWYTPWTDASNQEFELVEKFAQFFYFGSVADWTESLARR